MKIAANGLRRGLAFNQTDVDSEMTSGDVMNIRRND
jgi:hypothetical protein